MDSNYPYKKNISTVLLELTLKLILLAKIFKLLYLVAIIAINKLEVVYSMLWTFK